MLTIFFNIFSYKCTDKALDLAIEDADNQYKKTIDEKFNDEEYENIKKKFQKINKNVLLVNKIHQICFCFGLLFFTIYVIYYNFT
jgi:hypothetical protein